MFCFNNCNKQNNALSANRTYRSFKRQQVLFFLFILMLFKIHLLTIVANHCLHTPAGERLQQTHWCTIGSAVCSSALWTGLQSWPVSGPHYGFPVLRRRRPAWSDVYCSAAKQPILSLMKSRSSFSWEPWCWKHANTASCGTGRVGFGMNCDLPVKHFFFFVLSGGPLMIGLVYKRVENRALAQQLPIRVAMSG